MEMRLLCIAKRLGVDTFTNQLTAPNAILENYVKSMPGVGKPYLIFASFPNGSPVGADFTDAPIASADAAVNKANIEEMLANPPWDALIFA